MPIAPPRAIDALNPGLTFPRGRAGTARTGDRPMEFGMFHEFARMPGQSDAQTFSNGFEEVDLAERWGLEVMWLAELHVDPERSVLAAPLTIASAIATRTKRMKIGIAVQVLPLCHPLRLAEEVTTVDHISQGRLIMGVGRSGFPRTYEAYGISYAESRERFAEVLEIMRRAFTSDRFSFQGQFYHFDDVCLMPKPYQSPFPEIRIAATSPDTYAMIGALGYPIFCATRLGDLSELGPAIAAYREAWSRAGHPGEGQVFLRVPVYLAETAERARAEPEASVMHFYRVLGQRIEQSAVSAGARAIENRSGRGQKLQSITYDEVLQHKIIAGTPDMVEERLQGLRAELGLNGILAEMNCGGQIERPRMLTSLQLLCEQVMPRFKPSPVAKA
jgi:alkanesulfonate monooxygenase SsuD/methylene tetrahydromethanopterin reductase-like flavin-dependent oxidoreductase (luciferase family)